MIEPIAYNQAFFVQCDRIWANSEKFRTLSFLDFDPEFSYDFGKNITNFERKLPISVKTPWVFGQNTLSFGQNTLSFVIFSTLSFVGFAQTKSLSTATVHTF